MPVYGPCPKCGREMVNYLCASCLQDFKNWTHARLDAMGVPSHPPGVHGAEGCRIGDRMDWLEAEWKKERDRLEAIRVRTLAMVDEIREPGKDPFLDNFHWSLTEV